MIIAEYSSKSTILCYGIHFGHISINHLTMKLDYLDKKPDQKKKNKYRQPNLSVIGYHLPSKLGETVGLRYLIRIYLSLSDSFSSISAIFEMISSPKRFPAAPPSLRILRQ